MNSKARETLRRGAVIPASPLALNSRRRWNERRQRALFRYYLAAGAGGLAIGVHTTQFAIHHPRSGLYAALLDLGREAMDRSERAASLVRVAGICGETRQAIREAALARDRGFNAGLVSLGALARRSIAELIEHCRSVSEVLPIFGFYLQPAAGGRRLPYPFWRRLAELENIAAIKIAPFNRYQTLEVIRAVADSGRKDIALYTGNDDHIVLDLLGRFRFGRGSPEYRIAGGLLGQWAVWTRTAARWLEEIRALRDSPEPIPIRWLRRHELLTDANGAIFDAANGFAGCIPGIHEVLRRQGLLEGIWCLDPRERLSAGQAEEIDRVCRAYPELQDDRFVRAHLDEWLR